jgi:hypothetical protein
MGDPLVVDPGSKALGVSALPTARGGRRDRDSVNKRVLKPVLARADELLADRGQHPLPRG